MTWTSWLSLLTEAILLAMILVGCSVAIGRTLGHYLNRWLIRREMRQMRQMRHERRAHLEGAATAMDKTSRRVH